MIEVLPRQSEKARRLARSPRVRIDGTEQTALLSDAGRVSCPTRISRYIYRVTEEQVVVRYLPTAELLANRPTLLVAFLVALRWETLANSLMPIALGLLVADEIKYSLSAAVLGATLTMHMAANLVSEVYQYLWEDDLLFRHGGSKVLQRGWFTARQLLRAGICLGVISIILGVIAVLIAQSVWLLIIGVVGLAMGWQFSAPPLRLDRTLMGDILLLLIFGPVLSMCAFFAATGRISIESVGVGLMASAVTLLRRVLRNMRRLPDDAMVGHRTLALYLGFRGCKFAIVGSVIALLLGPAIYWQILGGTSAAIVPVLSAPFIVWGLLPAFKAFAPHDPGLKEAIYRFSWINHIYGAALITACIYARLT